MPKKKAKKEEKRIDEQPGTKQNTVPLPDSFNQITALGLGSLFDQSNTGATTFVVPSSREIKNDKLPEHK